MIFRVLLPVTALLVLMFGFIYPDMRKQASTSSLTASRNIEAAVTKTPKRPKTACPVKLTNSRMVHNLEEDVYTTVTNVSQSDITAISLGAAHTDKFGDTWQPYNTNLTSETGIKREHAVPMHWEVLMEEPSGIKGKRPGSSELFVEKIAFADGRVLGIQDLERCDFWFLSDFDGMD